MEEATTVLIDKAGDDLCAALDLALRFGIAE